jgi:enoyl-CoA hydratase/carnithine racemase
MSRATVLEQIIDDGVLTLTLHRPDRRNAFNDQLYGDLRAALADAQGNDAVRAVLLTGSGGAFSAGQDINEMGSGQGFTPFVDQLSTFEKPLLAAVNGVAVGIGVTMLLHCDLVYVAESARLRAPFAALGIVCEAGSSLLLPAMIGLQPAADVLFSARWVGAAEAVQIGLALQAVPDAGLLTIAQAKGREIAAQPPGAVRAIKKLLLAARSEALRAARDREDAAQAIRMTSAENRDAIRAFLDKRGR